MYCNCGTEIGVDSRWNGLVYRVVFTHEGEEISECPGCGESVIAWLECGEERLVYRSGSLLRERPNTGMKADAAGVPAGDGESSTRGAAYA